MPRPPIPARTCPDRPKQTPEGGLVHKPNQKAAFNLGSWAPVALSTGLFLFFLALCCSQKKKNTQAALSLFFSPAPAVHRKNHAQAALSLFFSLSAVHRRKKMHRRPSPYFSRSLLFTEKKSCAGGPLPIFPRSRVGVGFFFQGRIRGESSFCASNLQ